MVVEQVADPVTHGEGPVWADSWGRCRYVDIHAGDVPHAPPDARELRERAAALTNPLGWFEFASDGNHAT